MSLIAQVFSEVIDSQRCPCFKFITALVSEKPIAVNVLTSPKHYCNMQKRTFILLFGPFELIELEKVIFNQI